MKQCTQNEHRHSKRLRVLYGGHILLAEAGERLLDTILRSHEDHRHVCGGRGFCTSCRVEIVSGATALSRVSALERERLGHDAGRLRLACQTRVFGDAHVKVPRPAYGEFHLDDEPDRDGNGSST